MKRRKVVALVVLVLAAVAAAAAFLDPAARVEGWARGEPFYDGRSATGWRRALAQADANGRARATEELAAGKGEAVPVLAAVAGSAGPAEAKWRAIDALGRVGADARTAGPELIAALDDPDPHVRTVAARTLEQLAPHVPGAVPALVAAFPRVEAIRAAARYGPAAAEAVPRLLDLLRHDDPVVRWNAARALGKLKETGKPGIPALVAALGNDPSPEVREHAAEALGDIGPAAADAAVPALVKALADPAPLVRRDAVRALGEMGPAAKPVLADVQARKKDENPDVRAAAGVAERKIDPALAGKPGPVPEK